MSFLTGLNVSEKIALCGAIIAAIGVVVKVVLHFWPRKRRNGKSVEVGRIQGDGTVIGNKARVIVDKRKGVDGEVIFSKAMEVAEAKGRADEQISQLKDELNKAVQRIKQLEAGGNRPDAKKALQELRESGDMSRLQKLLIKDRDEHRDALIQRNREIAAVAYLRGDIDVAQAATDEVLRLEPNDIVALNQRGRICKLLGEFEEAEKAYLRVKELGVDAGNEQWQAAALGNLGVIYGTKGELGKAEEMLRESLKICEPAGMMELTANQYGNLGLIYQDRGQLDKAEEMHNKALEINKKLGRLEGMASQYGNLGVIYQMRSELDKAEEMFKKSLKISEPKGMMELTANQYGNLGNVYYMKGKLDKAEEIYEKVLKIEEKLGRPESIANAYSNLGLIYQKRGDNKKAREYWEKARDLYKKIGMPREVEKVEGWIEGLPK